MAKEMTKPTPNKGPLKINDKNVFDMINKRAYELYLARGRQHGYHTQDWVNAERQVKKELGLR